MDVERKAPDVVHHDDHHADADLDKNQLTEKQLKHGNVGAELVGDGRIELSPEDDKRIRRKTDKRILVILVWVYFLQILDKSAFGYGNIFGLSTDTKLVGNQYSLASTMNAYAQIAVLPFTSYLMVRVPSRYLMSGLVLGWGISQACMAAVSDFGGLSATRFLLGVFESCCGPLFSLLTSQWYRRSEQPIRIALWYGTNGPSTVFISILSFGLGHITNPAFKGWRAIYLVVGLITVLSVPLIYAFVDSDIPSARFLTEEEKPMAIERLRANQTGTGSNEYKWNQVWEMFYDPKSHLFFAMTLLLNVGAAVTNAFGPTLIANFGYDVYTTTLLAMPFGVIQLIVILCSSYAAQRYRAKGIALTICMLPALAGLVMIFVEANSTSFTPSVALGGYYLMAFIFGGNPLIISWIVSNTGGQTKRSATMCWYQIAGSVGNIIGPLLFDVKDKDTHYRPGVRAVMGIFVALIVTFWMMIVLLYFLNKQRQRQRVAHGKPEFIVDTSMSATYQEYARGGEGTATLGQNALLDLSDWRNDEFVYVY